jgi:signal transduction histidine kinase
MEVSVAVWLGAMGVAASETSAAVALLAMGAVSLLAVALLWQQWRKNSALRQTVERTRTQARQLERERDLAQQELWPRLREEQDLHKVKIQFQAQLAEYEKYAALAQLALGAAHEINNPLLGILSHLELQLKVEPDAETRSEIEQCIAGAKRISTTLRGLVNYARPGPLQLSKISLHRLVADTLSFVEGQPMLRGKEVQNLVPADLPHIRADANQLSQVLMNLLLNAAEATAEGGTITIAANKLTFVESVEVRVSDTGSGISPEVLPRVFEPFFTTKRGKGTGLGLSICQAYVRSHNGEIRADSVVDHGTTITLTLPIRQAALENEGQSEETSEVVV